MMFINSMRYYFRAFFILLILYFPFSARALELKYPHIPGFGDTNETLNSLFSTLTVPQLLQFFLALALWIAALVALGALIIAGITLTTSQGAPLKRLQAKKQILSVVVGISILMGIYILTSFINPQLTTLGGTYFKICDSQGITCSNPKFPTTKGPDGGGTTATQSSFSIQVFDLTEFAEISRLDIIPPGDTDLSDNTRTGRLGNPNWDEAIASAKIIGDGVATFYEFRNNNASGAWLKITKSGATVSCTKTIRTDSNTVGSPVACEANGWETRNNDNSTLWVHLNNIKYAEGNFFGIPTGNLCLNCSWAGGRASAGQGVISSLSMDTAALTPRCAIPASGICAPGALSAFGSHSTEAAGICQQESSSDPNKLNDGCLRGRYDYSVGMFQINFYRTGRCPGAFTDPNPTDGSDWKANEEALPTETCIIRDTAALAQCAQDYGVTLSFNGTGATVTASDPALQIQKAMEISSNGTNWCPWTSAKPEYCGLCINR